MNSEERYHHFFTLSCNDEYIAIVREKRNSNTKYGLPLKLYTEYNVDFSQVQWGRGIALIECQPDLPVIKFKNIEKFLSDKGIYPL